MSILYPFVFSPVFKERVWGGRQLETLYAKPLPACVKVGESWEIADHGDDVSVIRNGPLAGKTLRWLMENHQGELLGEGGSLENRFPLLIKILDAQEKLSLQVHPPASKAAKLGGEPKTEMWYITSARPGADLFVGLQQGTTRQKFEERLEEGTVAECFHRLEVKAGDAIFLPSGRVHAIGAGNVIFEIQQNSDTTYRVFDWNRLGLDGRPRELHLEEALESINFEDFEPGLISRDTTTEGVGKRRILVRSPLFGVDHWKLESGVDWRMTGSGMQIVGVVNGYLEVRDVETEMSLELNPGEFCLVPAASRETLIKAGSRTEFLHVTRS